MPCLAGTFGIVYKAILDDVHDVAVKLMRPGHVDDRQLQSFCNEVGHCFESQATQQGPDLTHSPCKARRLGSLCHNHAVLRCDAAWRGRQ